MKKSVFLSVLILSCLLTWGIVAAQTTDEYQEALRYYEKGNFSEAVNYLKMYVDKKPDPSAYYLLGYSLYKLGRHSEASEYFKQAYLIDPNFSPQQMEYFKKQPKEEMKEIERLSREPEEKAATPEEPLPQEAVPAEPQSEVVSPEPEMVPAPSQAPLERTPAQKVDPSPAQVQPLPSPARPETPAEKKTQLTEPQQVRPAQPMPPAQPASPAPFSSEKPPALPMPPLFPALLAGFMTLFLIIEIAVYIFFSLCLFFIAKKLSVPAPGLAFVPIVQLWTMVASAGKSGWWILLLLIPIVNIFVGIYIWLCITENLGKNKWLGLLILLPLINLIYMGWLAFSKGEGSASPGPGAPETEF
ncbi:MAG: DUF5684 domain-containing protein [bacterium]